MTTQVHGDDNGGSNLWVDVLSCYLDDEMLAWNKSPQYVVV